MSTDQVRRHPRWACSCAGPPVGDGAEVAQRVGGGEQPQSLATSPKNVVPFASQGTRCATTGTPASHRTTAQWMGEPVLTLEDVWPARPRGVSVGLNLTPTSVAAAHYDQGRSGQRQLLRLGTTRA